MLHGLWPSDHINLPSSKVVIVNKELNFEVRPFSNVLEIIVSAKKNPINKEWISLIFFFKKYALCNPLCWFPLFTNNAFYREFSKSALHIYTTKGRDRFHWAPTPLKPYRVGNICYMTYRLRVLYFLNFSVKQFFFHKKRQFLWK